MNLSHINNLSVVMSSMGVYRNVSMGRQRWLLLMLFRLLKMQCKWTFMKRFILSIPLRKRPMLVQQSKNALRWQQLPDILR